MSLHMAAGMLFLGGGGFTLSRCDTSDEALVALWKAHLGSMHRMIHLLRLWLTSRLF
jgi:hypothetical protein